jgi:hypothetical protein
MLQVTNHPLYRKHDLDSAMNSLWEFYKSNFLSLFLISFVMSLIIQYGSTFINTKELQDALVGFQKNPDPSLIVEKMKVFFWPMLILTVVSMFFGNIFHYYILHKPLDSNKNIFISVLESIKYFIPYLIVIIILAFFGSFAIAMGLLVFIVGVFFSVVYLMMISFFILPVMMTEGIHIGNTIIRTARFSHRNFWSNVGWTSVFLILLIVFSLVVSSIVTIPFTLGSLKSILNPDVAGQVTELAKNPIFIILTSAVNALTLPLMPIFGFILYFNGRAREEQVQTPSYGDDNYKVRVEDLYAKPVHEDKEDKQELKS